MEEKFYTIDQIAEILGMHHKTIRKFITEGKLRANKVGKQWRISGHDLSLFMENNNVNVRNKNEVENEKIEFSTGSVGGNNIRNQINVSTVIDINEIDSDEYRRISNMLLAAMNSKDPKMSNSTINMKHYQNERNLKVMLWGDTEFTKEMLDYISILTKSNDI
ncbi:MAG: helix-turn-helix domain-containing protein [Paraclostridium bifermentans]|uniref:Helix-turn-helix domain-containing protein n=1 Tax=Paraclostridium bifermentans TaxID=1490 RepID=A0ABY8R895_PARBF|nr:helix-turn-helix domain-containing protein [Paraclostridium bifermentans]MBS6508477.1 helix-turn-helix domain-containing protein [Paraclostridium bifermentans]WGX77774.1 helix-turn-helix domain-containing protein [Paraclostridium bifermentans]